jgi:hypothetical protein
MQAAAKHGIEPRSISFKRAVQTLEAFQSVIAIQGQHDNDFRLKLYRQLLNAIATYRVVDRPNRFEPSLRKRRPSTMRFSGNPGMKSNAIWQNTL